MAAFSPKEHDMGNVISSLAAFNQQMTTTIDKTTDDVIPRLNIEMKSAEAELHSYLFQSIPYLVKCYQSMGVKTTKDFYTNPVIGQSVEVETQLKTMDRLMYTYNEVLRRVDDIICHESTKGVQLRDIILNDVLTKEEQSLGTILQRSKYTLLVMLRHFA